MILRVGRNKPNIGRSILSTTVPVIIQYAFAWDIGFYHKSGGLKKDLYIFGSADCPIKDIKIELNKRLMGAGIINMSYIDFPIHPDDYVIIKYKGVVVYRGLIDHAPDINLGRLKLVPYSTRFKEILINKTYTSQTAKSMLNDIINSIQSDTDISWNNDLVDTGETDTYTKTFQYVKAEKAIKEIVGELTDREWGVTVNNVFTVYQPNTAVDKMFFQSFEPIYTEVQAKNNWNKIKATRYQVYKKSSGGVVTRQGEVGYGGAYPAIEIENRVRKKEGKFVIDTLVSSTEALDLAYSELQNITIPLTVKVKNVNLDEYFPAIGDRLQVQEKEEKVLKTIIDCNSSDGWTGVSLDSADYTEGTASLTFSASSSGDQITYDFGSNQEFRYPERLGLMVKASITGSYLQIGMSNDSSTLFDNAISLPIYTANVWQYRDIPRSTGFRYFGINTSSAVGGTSTVKVDEISLFLWDRKIYEANVVQADIEISPGNDRLAMITLNEYDEEANADQIEIKNKIDNIETVNQST